MRRLGKLGRTKRTNIWVAAALLHLSAYSLCFAQQGRHTPALPAPVVKLAPGIHPLGKARHSWFGVPVFDATLWIVGNRWSPTEPHALNVDSNREVPADALVKAVMDEMQQLKIGDDSTRQRWRSQMTRTVPALKKGDELVILQLPSHKTVIFYNNQNQGELDDKCGDAVFRVWLDPSTRYQRVRKDLLKE